jgi:hypothetical protein
MSANANTGRQVDSMTNEPIKIVWAPKVNRAKIQHLYASDAQGMIDEELLAEVGWALWSRCDSILTVTAAHYGRLNCPSCRSLIEHPGIWSDEDQILCAACGWQMPWAAYHQTYRGKQLFGANAVESFETYHKAFPQALETNQKMLLVDQLIHAFHFGLTEIGRPAGANLIQGTLKEVIQFLDALTNNGSSAAGLADSRDQWRRTLESGAWTKPFIPAGPNEEGKKNI